jgi:hypothetical protein
MAKLEHWAVTVQADGETVIAIESNCLSGRELSDADEAIIRNAAEHLLSFLGLNYQISEREVVIPAHDDMPF